MAYLSTATLKTYLGITSTADDTLLATLITEAQRTIDRMAGTTFEIASDSTMYFDARANVRGRDLFFGRWCASITSITNGDGVAVSSSNYVTEPRNATVYHGVRLLGSSTVTWTWTTDPENAIAVVGKWGYSTTAPADIAEATKYLAAYAYRSRDNSNASVAVFGAEDESKKNSISTFPKIAQEIAMRYRVPVGSWA